MKTKGGEEDRGVRVFSMSENQCVWMKAGVVNFKLSFRFTTSAGSRLPTAITTTKGTVGRASNMEGSYT